MRVGLEKERFLNRQGDGGGASGSEVRRRERESLAVVVRVVLDFGWGFQKLNKELEILKKIKTDISIQINVIKSQLNQPAEPTKANSSLIEPYLQLYHLLDSSPLHTSAILELTKSLKHLISKSIPPISQLPLPLPLPSQPPETPIRDLQTIEGSGLSELRQTLSTYPEAVPSPSFDMNSLKSSLKPPNCKVLYKQVSDSGSVTINEKPSSPKARPQLAAIPTFPSLSFKDFLQSGPKTLITLEALGENSDSDL